MSINPSLMKTIDQVQFSHSPIAVAFLDAPPAGLPRVDRKLAAGCGYWKHASDGHAFYTTGEDHQGCPVGAFTHGVTLPPATAAELQALVGTMIELKYLDSKEVPSIPHRERPMEIAAYAPLDRAAFAPDVVIFRGNARQIMLISEAARSAGIFGAGAAMGRPACAVIPQAISAANAGIASIGCIGNRVYTELGDDELYFAVPGAAVEPTLEHLSTILTANNALEAFHRQRKAALQ
jgi:uncharacterized protein (DUF169 family)